MPKNIRNLFIISYHRRRQRGQGRHAGT